MSRFRHLRLLALCAPAVAVALTFAAPAPAQFVEPTCVIHTFVGESGGDNFGWVSAPLRDLDGDGAAEVVVTAPFRNASTGRIYVYSGRSGVELFHTDGPGAGAKFGFSARDAGDVDRDGKTDIVVGATGGGNVPGRAFVVSGANGSIVRTIQLGATDDQLGYSVAGMGDVDGDGHADVAVGAIQHDAAGNDAGRVWLVSGADGATVLWTRDGRNAGHNFGSALANIGDLDGDGQAELAVGAMNAGTGEGRAYVFDVAVDRRLYPMQPLASATNFGQFFIATPGDVNGDRVNDVYVSDFADTTLGNGTGRAYVFDGTNGSLVWSLAGTAAGEGFGIGRGVGDVDGDGFGDLILCGWTDGTGAPGAGKASIVSGRTARVLRTYTSTTAGENLGFDAHGVGDVNGDGRRDYFVTAATYRGSTGRCFLISGCDGEASLSRQGVAGSGGIEPTIGLDGCPSFGLTPSIAIRAGLGGASCGIVIGASQVSIPIGAGTLFAAPHVIFAAQLTGPAGAPGVGATDVPITVPNQPSLAGATLYIQAGVADPGAPVGLALTRLLTVVVR